MPQPDDAASQYSAEASLKDRRPSLTDSDVDTTAEQDAFEDAVDAASVRSLTKRSVSISKPQPPPPEHDATKSNADSDSEEEEDEEEQEANSVKSEEKPEPPSRGSSPVSHRISNISNTSNLDVVNLDDDAAPQHQEPTSPSDKEQLSRTTSLNNSSAAAQPSSPNKSLPPIPAASTTPTVAVPPATAPTPAPAPVGRRLTSPFSWLSRNSSKDKDVNLTANTQPTARRNTASSVATVGSNPEMMLSKLEEEREGDGKASNRNSLKDRFKVLRMQQETGAPLTINTEDIPDETEEGEALPAADLPPPSPLPPPSTQLAPGTAAGINVGPSETTTSQVDWDLWQSVVYEGPAAVARSSAEELNKAIATGIPSAIRGVIWQVLAQSKSEDLEGVYRDLLDRGTEKENRNRHSSSTAASSFSNANLSVQSGDGVASSASSVNSEQSGSSGLKGDKKEVKQEEKKDDKNAEAIAKAQAAAVAERMRKEKEDIASIQRLEKVIRRDLGARTSYSKYAAAAGLQEGLFGVCKAYALFDEGVGYAQGMNFLIMPLLFNMPEQEAFCLLVRLMNHYGLRDLFIHDMPGLHRHLYQFERLLEDLEPALYCHLHRRGISPHLYATPWFLTLFAYRFPLQLVLRIYDLILSEGLSAIIRFGIVLMQKNTATLLEISDMQQLTTYLKDKLFDVYIDKDPSQGSLLENGFFGSSSSSIDKEIYRADQLVRDACEIKLSAELLEGYTAEWEEKTKTEKDRETEIKELRTSSQSLTIQVRKLEERVEVADREQADLATELVHTKVENDELKDEVEALRNQVQELKKVIEKQPFEIEETWKLERDDLMKRNEKVHLENEKVEKELAELEEELVQTKLRYAEIAGQHETLNRKWTELKRHIA
ncbi:rab-GTPase-TBC domain-containing protein [Trichoderma chlorosporum]